MRPMSSHFSHEVNFSGDQGHIIDAIVKTSLILCAPYAKMMSWWHFNLCRGNTVVIDVAFTYQLQEAYFQAVEPRCSFLLQFVGNTK